MMPVMSGYEFLDSLKRPKDEQRPLVIVLTAGAPPRDLDPQVVAGTIRKPFDIEMLVDTVTACLWTLHDAKQRDDCATPDSETAERSRPRRPA
jgi:CheY-like chemotaxis protein